MKLCKDCKHYERNNPVFMIVSENRCIRNCVIEPCLVTGRSFCKGVPLICETERKDGWLYNGRCGTEGKYFEEND